MSPNRLAAVASMLRDCPRLSALQQGRAYNAGPHQTAAAESTAPCHVRPIIAAPRFGRSATSLQSPTSTLNNSSISLFYQRLMVMRNPVRIAERETVEWGK